VSMLTFQGRIPAAEVEFLLSEYTSSCGSMFLPWLPDSLKTSFVDVPPEGQVYCSSLLTNTTAVRPLYLELSAEFNTLFRRKAYIYGITKNGMDEMEFFEAQANLNDLIHELDPIRYTSTPDEREALLASTAYDQYHEFDEDLLNLENYLLPY
jgi:tubulin beta